MWRQSNICIQCHLYSDNLCTVTSSMKERGNKNICSTFYELPCCDDPQGVDRSVFLFLFFCILAFDVSFGALIERSDTLVLTLSVSVWCVALG